MIKRTSLLLTLLALFWVATAQSQSYSLQQCIEYALKNNASIKNAKIDVEIAKSKVWETTAIGLPQVNANTQFQRFIDIPTVLIPSGAFGGPPGGFTPNKFGTNYAFSYGLDASLILFDGNYLLGLQATSVYKDLSKKSLDRNEVETTVAVTKAYYNALVSTERLTLLDANIIRLKKTLDDTKAFYENGFAEKIDFDRLQVLYNNLVVEKQKIEQLSALGLLVLKFQMGMDVQEPIALSDKLDAVPFKPIIEKTDSVTYNLRPEYNVLETAYKLNKLDLKRNKVTYLPSVVAFATHSQNSQDDYFSTVFFNDKYTFPTTIIGIKATMPIFGGFSKYQKLKQAQLAVQKSENDLYNIKNVINLEAQSAQTTYNNSLASLDNQKKNRELAQDIVRVTKIKYEQGVGSGLEVVTAETSLKEAETNYIAALYDALIAKVEVDKALGLIK